MISLFTCTLTLFSTMCFGAGPYAPEVVTDSDGTKIATYTYNTAGHRLLDGNGQNLKIGLIGKVVSLTQIGRPQITRHGLDQRRYLRTHANGSKSIYLAGGTMEYRIPADNQAAPETVYFVSDGKYSPVAQVRKTESSNPDYDFYIKDHLGSPLVIVDPQRNYIERRHYEPWGQTINAQGVPVDPSTEHKGFTGHETLNRTLIDMNARYYDASKGVFLAPDPVIEAPVSLPSLNRYSYVNNSVPNWTDATGLNRFTSTGNLGRLFIGKTSKALMEAGSLRDDLLGNKFVAVPSTAPKAGLRAGDVFKTFPENMTPHQAAQFREAFKNQSAVVVSLEGRDLGKLTDEQHNEIARKIVNSTQTVHPPKGYDVTTRRTVQAQGKLSRKANFAKVPHLDNTNYTLITVIDGPGTSLAYGGVRDGLIDALSDGLGLFGQIFEYETGIPLDVAEQMKGVNYVELKPGQTAFIAGGHAMNSGGLFARPLVHAAPNTNNAREIIKTGIKAR